MKLVTAIVHNEDAATLVDALLDPSQSRLVKLSGQQLQPAPRRCRDLLL